MSLYTQLLGLFTPEAIRTHLKNAEPIDTTVIDTFFPKTIQSLLPAVGVADLYEAAKTIPMVMRGGSPISLKTESMQMDLVEPLPLKGSYPITGRELNDLRMILGNAASAQAWRNSRIEYLRQVLRHSAEAVAAKALTGAITWPVRLDGGQYDTWTYAWGATKTVAAAIKWDSAEPKPTAADIRALLKAMRTQARKRGLGAKIRYLAGEDAFQAAFNVVESMTAAQALKVGFELKQKEGAIDFGGFLLEEFSETYPDPRTSADTPKVPANAVVALPEKAFTRFYAALDNIKAGLQPLPIFVHVVEDQRGGGFELIGESKVLPAPVSDAIVWATVL